MVIIPNAAVQRSPTPTAGVVVSWRSITWRAARCVKAMIVAELASSESSPLLDFKSGTYIVAFIK